MDVDDRVHPFEARAAHGAVARHRASTWAPVPRPESPSLVVARRARARAQSGDRDRTARDASYKDGEHGRRRRTECDHDVRNTRPYACGRLKCSAVRGRRLATGIVCDVYALDHSVCNATVWRGRERLSSYTMSRVYDIGRWPRPAHEFACMTPSEVVARCFLCSDACVRSIERNIRFKHSVCARTSRGRVPSVCHCGVYVGFAQRLPNSNYWRFGDGPMTSSYRAIATLRSYGYTHDEEHLGYGLSALQENHLVHTSAVPDDDAVSSDGSSVDAVDEELYERVVRPDRPSVEC